MVLVPSQSAAFLKSQIFVVICEYFAGFLTDDAIQRVGRPLARRF
jgi:hypothetical protein